MRLVRRAKRGDDEEEGAHDAEPGLEARLRVWRRGVFNFEDSI